MTLAVQSANFESEVVNSPEPVLVDFWAPWCGPCRQLSPVVDELSRELAGKVKVVKINVDEAPDIAARYRVSSIPNLVLLNGGEVQASIVGFQPKSALLKALSPILG